MTIPDPNLKIREADSMLSVLDGSMQFDDIAHTLLPNKDDREAAYCGIEKLRNSILQAQGKQ